jgi:hypothetical protein
MASCSPLTHLVAGAALGRLTDDRRRGAIAGVVSHALLDGIGLSLNRCWR